ncbi:MAG: L,D-transpeptidase family protein [Deltaproteobacteria bacterium]|nr:L,D-transpeptidase family protein [Deltaproteobacteria bacterium]
MVFSKRRQAIKIIFMVLFLFSFTEWSSSSQEKGNSPEGLVPEALVSVDSTEDNKEYAIIIEKESQLAYLYECGSTFREISLVNCSTGEVKGTKSRSGDRKTPEGVYFFTKEHKKKDLTPIYGSAAFPIDYPNCMDLINGNGGNSIWMHGTNKKLKQRDTNGCIVFENKDIERLSNYIALNRTPVIIVDKIKYKDENSNNEEDKPVEGFLLQWRNSLQNGDYHEYLAFYDPGYLPDIGWWPVWNDLRKKTYSLNLPFSVEIKRKSIFKHETVYVVLFDLVLSASGKNMPVATKKLFLTHRGERLRIIGEEYQYIPEELERERDKNPLVAALDIVRSEDDKEKKIAEMVDRWLKAWSSKNIDEYGKYYSRDFYSDGMALKAWLRHKKRLNRKYGYISVTKDNLVITEKGEKLNASFLQTYKSSGYKAVGKKTLELKYEQGEWKIFRESWADIQK